MSTKSSIKTKSGCELQLDKLENSPKIGEKPACTKSNEIN